MRFLGLVKAAEGQGAPPQGLMDAMGAFIERSKNAGVLVETGGLGPAAASPRVRMSGGHLTVLDGPFSESKEMVGGYAILTVDTLDKAIEVAKEFMGLHVTHWPEWEGECEIRQIFGVED